MHSQEPMDQHVGKNGWTVCEGEPYEAAIMLSEKDIMVPMPKEPSKKENPYASDELRHTFLTKSDKPSLTTQPESSPSKKPFRSYSQIQTVKEAAKAIRETFKENNGVLPLDQAVELCKSNYYMNAAWMSIRDIVWNCSIHKYTLVNNTKTGTGCP